MRLTKDIGFVSKDGLLIMATKGPTFGLADYSYSDS